MKTAYLMMTQRKIQVLSVLMLLLLAGVANAANVHMIRGSSSGSGGAFDWTNSSTWDDGNGVSAANSAINAQNDYWCGKDETGTTITMWAGSTPPHSFRPPSAGGYFYGKSLHLATITVSMRPGHTTSWTLPNCFATSTTFNNQASPGGTPSESIGVVNGTVAGTGTGYINLSSSGGGRIMNFNNLFTGNVTSMAANMSRTTNANGTSDTIYLNNSLNDITGTTFSQSGGKLVLADTGVLGHFGKFTSNSIVLPTGGLRLPNTDVIFTSMTRYPLDVHSQFKSLTIRERTGAAEKTLAPGVYTVSDLAAQFTYNGTPIFSGGSTLTIGVEPNAVKKAWMFD